MLGEGSAMPKGTKEWLASLPVYEGALAADLDALQSFAVYSEGLLRSLGPPAGRSASERNEAEAIKSAVRRARRSFLKIHVAAVYDRITGNCSQAVRLDGIVSVASSEFPGLIPSNGQMEIERSRPLLEREGHEIDYGVFVQAVLRSPRAGKHLLESMLRPSPRASQLFERFREEGSVRLETVRLERCGRAAHVTIENISNLNSEDVPLLHDLEAAIDLVTMDPDIRVGVVRGGEMVHPKYRGRRVFCAGINLKAFGKGEIPLIEFLLAREMGLVNKLRHGVLTGSEDDPSDATQKPWLAIVDGFAIGGGMQLLLNFDRVIAAKDAYFSLPAANEGIIPGAANLRLGHYTGGRLARQIILFGRRIGATDPEAELFCDEVAAPENLDSAIHRAVAALENSAVPPNRRMINLAEEPLGRVQAYLAEFAYLQAVRMYSPDVASRLQGGIHGDWT